MDHMLRHLGVDLARQFNETCMLTILARFPCQIKRVDWDAMTAQTRSRIKRHEPKRFGFGGIDHFPYVDAHRVVNDL